MEVCYEELTHEYERFYHHPLMTRPEAATLTAAMIVARSINSLTASVDNLVEVLCDKHPTFTPSPAVTDRRVTASVHAPKIPRKDPPILDQEEAGEERHKEVIFPASRPRHKQQVVTLPKLIEQ